MRSRSIRTLSTLADSKKAAASRTIDLGLGKEYLLRSLTLISAGVTPDGEYIPADVLEYSTVAFSGRGVYDIAPGSTDLTPAFNDQHLYGHLFYPRISGSNLTGEIWLSKDRAKLLKGSAADIFARFETDKPVEVRAAVEVEIETRSGKFEGAPYSRVWTRIVNPIGVSIVIPADKVSANRSSARYAAEAEYAHRVQSPQSIRAAKSPHKSVSPSTSVSIPTSHDRSIDMEKILQGAIARFAAQAEGNVLDDLINALSNLSLHPKSGFGRSRLSTLTGQGRNLDIDHLFANHLTDLRTAAGLTQKALGAQLDVSDQTVSNWTTGTTTPSSAVRDAVISHLIGRIMTRMDQEIPIPQDRMEEAFAIYQTTANLQRYLFLGRTPAMPTSELRNESAAGVRPEHTPGDPSFNSWSAAGAIAKRNAADRARAGDPHGVAKYLDRNRR